MIRYQVNTKSNTSKFRKDLLLLLFVPVLLVIFAYSVYQPFEYKKFLIYIQRDFDSIQLDLKNETFILESTTDNSDISTLLLYYQGLEHIIYADQTFIADSRFTTKKVSIDINSYYHDILTFSQIKKEQTDLLYFLISSDNFNRELNKRITLTDDYSEINNLLASGIKYYSDLEQDVGSLKIDPTNASLHNQIKEYMHNSQDYYTKTSDLMTQLVKALASSNLDQVRNIQTQIKTARQAYLDSDNKFFTAINTEATNLRTFVSTTNASLVKKSEWVRTNLQKEMDDMMIRQ